MDIQLASDWRHIRAFTLIELIIAIAIITVLLSAGIPGFRSLSCNSSISTAVSSMAAHLQLARSEAIKRASQVVLCPSLDREHCSDSFEWQRGFIIYADNNGNRARDPSEPLLRFHRPDNNRVRIFTSAGRKKLAYKPSGMAPGSTATITVCDRARIAEPRAIILSNPGRARFSKTRADGSSLECG